MPDAMGGDQKVANANVDITPVKPAWYPPYTTTITNQPGQLGNLAKDMAAGGFSTYEPDLAWLRNVFRPMNSVAYNLPEGTSKKKPPTKDGGGKVEDPKWPVEPGGPSGLGKAIGSRYQWGPGPDGRGGTISGGMWNLVPDPNMQVTAKTPKHRIFYAQPGGGYKRNGSY